MRFITGLFKEDHGLNLSGNLPWKGRKRNSSLEVSLDGIITHDSNGVRCLYLSLKFHLEKGVSLGFVDLRCIRESEVVRVDPQGKWGGPYWHLVFIPFVLLRNCHLSLILSSLAQHLQFYVLNRSPTWRVKMLTANSFFRVTELRARLLAPKYTSFLRINVSLSNSGLWVVVSITDSG